MGPVAEATRAGLGMAGYSVVHVTSAVGFEATLAERGPAGANTLRAVIVDLSHDDGGGPEAQALLEAERALDSLPKVFLIRSSQPSPSGENVMVLKRPISTPALTRLLDYSLSSSSSMVSSISGVQTSLSGPRPIMEQREIGDYELIERIASGGMGTVYLAQRSNQAGFSRLYAIKLMHPHLIHDRDFQGMFLDEAALASRIHHPNVAAIVDLGMQGDRPYVVLQYVEGCSLAQLFRATDGPRPMHLVVPILIDALEGLRAAHDLTDDEGHSLGIVHRDVSPDNILVGLDGVARITDFGVAKARGRVTSTRKGVRKGKLLYLAPEQINDGAELDARVDIFAAGAVLWQGLTGKRLFQAESPAAVMRNVMEAKILPPSSLNPAVPEALDEICLRALQRDPDARYASSRDMGATLRAVAREFGLLGTPEAIGEWVETVQGPSLRTRRRTIQRARKVRPSESLPTFAQAAAGGRTLVASSHTEVEDMLSPNVATPAPTQPAFTTTATTQPTAPWKLIVLAALVGSVSAVAVSLVTCGDKTPPVEEQPRAAQAPAPSAAPKASEPAREPANVRKVEEAPPPNSPADNGVAEVVVVEKEPEPEPAADDAGSTPPEPADDGAGSTPPEPADDGADATEPPATTPRSRASRRRSRRKPPREAPKPEPAPAKPTPTPAPAKTPPKNSPSDPLRGGPELNPYK